MNSLQQAFFQLTPEVIDQCVALAGFQSIGRQLPLNSVENRVYDIEIDENSQFRGPFSKNSIVLKVFRPHRWTAEILQEEIDFVLELKQLGIPVVAPICIDGQALFTHQKSKLMFSVYPKIMGRLKDELDSAEISQVGRLLGRIHSAGRSQKFSHRPSLHPDRLIGSHLETFEGEEHIPKNLQDTFLELCRNYQAEILPLFKRENFQRIHGDFHRGNILWTLEGPFCLDFDDCAMGPCNQDLWPLFPGQDSYAQSDREKFLEAYDSMAIEKAQYSPLFTEALRGMRMIHFTGWIAERYSDPSFQRLFPSFLEHTYWDQQILDLRAQTSVLQELKYA